MAKNRIQNQKGNALNENDRLELARLLIKAGYSVRMGREKPQGKQNAAYINFVEYWEASNNDQN